MKILLVRPPVPRHTIGLKHIMICEPLELEYTAAGLKDHNVQIMDMILESGFRNRLEKFKPDIVGTSSYISGVNEVIKLFREVKRWNPKCLTVVGGVQASQVPEDFIDNSVDVIVRGDGTTLFPQVVQALEGSKEWFDIPNLAFPSDEKNLIKTEARPYMPNPDDLPLPNRDLVKHLQHKYYYLTHRPVATMKTTWGCWYKCNFCYTWRITEGHPYSRSPESIAKELLSIDANEVYIVDDIFLIKPKRLKRLAELIREHNIKKHYLIYARADFIAANEEIISEWSELGLTAVFIGLEAVTDNELDSMNKESSVNENLAAIRMLQKYQIDIYGSLIPHPDYSREDWQRLRNFIKKSGLYYVNISPLMAMPGTFIWEEWKDKMLVPREAHGLWDLSHALMKTKLPLKTYYRELMKTYASVLYNLPRAKKVTQRTLPNFWSWNYIRLLIGSSKIGWQFFNAHNHHAGVELRKALDKGKPLENFQYSAQRMKITEPELEQTTV